MNLLYMEAELPQIIICLAVVLILLTKSVFNMINKKSIKTFMPFFVLGLALCMTAGFMYYGFFGIAADMFLLWKFVAIIGMCVILWGNTK